MQDSNEEVIDIDLQMSIENQPKQTSHNSCTQKFTVDLFVANLFTDSSLSVAVYFVLCPVLTSLLFSSFQKETVTHIC